MPSAPSSFVRLRGSHRPEGGGGGSAQQLNPHIIYPPGTLLGHKYGPLQRGGVHYQVGIFCFFRFPVLFFLKRLVALFGRHNRPPPGTITLFERGYFILGRCFIWEVGCLAGSQPASSPLLSLTISSLSPHPFTDPRGSLSSGLVLGSRAEGSISYLLNCLRPQQDFLPHHW